MPESNPEPNPNENPSSLVAEFLVGFQNVARDLLVTFFKRNVVFKARVQSGRRISIPEEEMIVAGIKEGDIVQVIIVPLSSERSK